MILVLLPIRREMQSLERPKVITSQVQRRPSYFETYIQRACVLLVESESYPCRACQMIYWIRSMEAGLVGRW